MNWLTKLRALIALNAVYETAVDAARKENAMGNKNPLKSKTFWFNVIAGVIGFAQQQGLFELVPAPYGPAIVILGNLALRFVTSQPVSLTAPL